MRLLAAAFLASLIVAVVGFYSWFLAGRQALRASGEAPSAADRKRMVCSTTQVADFARQVVGDRWEVVSILAPGQDPHLYELKPGDAGLVAQADLCLQNGWHLEGHDWMERLARGAGIPLVTCVDGIEPLILEEDGPEVRDPHAWFSPVNAAQYVRNILAAVCAADPGQRDEYQRRAELYLRQLDAVHAWATSQCARIPAERRILVTSHDAFHYFCRAYGFRSASVAGWSTGDEVGGGATPERRREAAAAIRQFGVKAIFVETSVNPKMVRALAEDAGVRIGGELYSDSMGPPGSAGETYVGMLRENILTIVEALE